METPPGRPYSGEARQNVSTLPIRNGNLWGAIRILLQNPRQGEYLTYKEWKLHSSFMSGVQARGREYLTYKEWKRYAW